MKMYTRLQVYRFMIKQFYRPSIMTENDINILTKNFKKPSLKYYFFVECIYSVVFL